MWETYVCVYLCRYVYMSVCASVCIHTYIHTCAHTHSFCNRIDSITVTVTVTVTVTGNLLNTKVLTLVSRRLSQPVQSPNYMQCRPSGTRQGLPRALPSTNPYYQIASPHLVESGGIPDVGMGTKQHIPICICVQRHTHMYTYIHCADQIDSMEFKQIEVAKGVPCKKSLFKYIGTVVC
jgi:hypothetical protein